MNQFNYLTRIILITALFICGNTHARMYQWIDSNTKTTQLSGKPPAWYRGAAGGPRVFVFDNGRLIDDTAITVSDEVRQRMRQQAFVLAEEDRQKAQEKLARSKELKEKFQDEVSETKDLEIKDDDLTEIVEADINYQAKQSDVQDEETTAEQLEKLKKIVSDFDKLQSENAKANAEKALK